MKKRSFLIATAVIALATTVGLLTIGGPAAGQEKAIVLDRAHEGDRAPSFDKPFFFVILGGDARVGNPDRQRTDSIHILGIDPVKNRASIVGIPRDSYMASPCGGSRKITDTGGCGGVDAVISALEDFSGCRFDYKMVTAFQGFRGVRGSRVGGLVNQMGGITVNVTERLTKAVPVPVARGKNKLNGAEALSFARNRYERPRGDFDRSLAQGKLMIAALAEARADYKKDPGTALRNLAVLRRNVKMSIGLKEALDLGLMAMKVNPKKVENIVVDGASATENGSSIVRVSSEGRAELTDICADGLLDQS